MVAYHFQQAGDQRAARWLIRAGVRAERAYAWLSSASRYEDAQVLLQNQPERKRDRAWLLLRIRRVQRYLDIVDTLPYVEEARRIAQEVGDEILVACCDYEIGTARFNSGIAMRQGLAEADAAATILEQMSLRHGEPMGNLMRRGLDPDIPTFGIEDPSASAVVGVGVLPPRGVVVSHLAAVGRYHEARTMGEAYVKRCDASMSDSDDVHHFAARDAYRGLAMFHWAMGEPDLAQQLVDLVFHVHRSIGNFVLASRSKGSTELYFAIRYAADRPEHLHRLAEEAIPLLQLAKGLQFEARESPGTVWLTLLSGDWDQARGLADQMLAFTSARSSDGAQTASAVTVLSRYQGLHDDVWSCINELLPDGPSTEPGNQEFWSAMTLQIVAAELSLDVGDLDLARSWIESYQRWLDWSGAVLGRAEGALLWAQYRHANGDRDQARAMAERALAHATDPRQPLALIAVHRFLGQLYTEEQRFSEAEEHLQPSLRLAEACAAPFERALTLLEIAKLRAAQKRPDEARTLLAEVRATCEPLKAKPTLDRVAALELQLTDPPE